MRNPGEIWADWMAANDARDRSRAGVLADELTRSAPGSFRAWFEAGLHSKAMRDWHLCAERNSRALELFTPAVAEEYGGVNPAAWNLGIAATALGNWASARRAWTAYGIAGFEAGSDPIDVDFGQVPIRLNPDRPSLALQDLPDLGTTEVVWCARRSPAHAVIVSVPLPESGHRFHDVLLHDGEPKGTRQLGEIQVSVFDELDKLVDSRIPTWQAVVEGATDADVVHLGDVAGERGVGADDWSGLNVLCADCSHGNPDAGHHHAPTTGGQTLIGLAGTENVVRDCLSDWRRDRPHLRVADLQLL